MSGITRISTDEPEKDNIILIGYMGAGKTSVGQACASVSGAELLDTDDLIEKKEKKTISEIFDDEGEEAFRDMETGLIRGLIDSCDHCVISVGGGLPLRGENRVLLKKLGTVIFLRVKRESVLKRLEGDTTRPNLRGDDLAQKADAMLAVRNPLYLEGAHYVTDTDDKTPEEIAREVLAAAGWS